MEQIRNHTEQRSPRPCMGIESPTVDAAVWLDALTDDAVHDQRVQILDRIEDRS